MDRDALLLWVKTYLPFPSQQSDISLCALAGDAGFRHYFRVNSSPSVIAVIAPPEREDNSAFVHKGLALAAGGVHVPRVYAVDYQLGYMLQEDLGDKLYLNALRVNTAAALYSAAEDALLAMQRMQPPAGLFGDYDSAELYREMGLFPRWFVGELLGISPTAEEQRNLDTLFAILIDNALQQPQVVVHRDFHGRNLLVLEEGGVGVVDYQDAVVGAITYDLVSLLKDCYIRWPPAMVRQRALHYRDRLVAAGSMTSVDDQTFLRWFDLMGLQRHIKVLGIFARLSLRDGKHRYLDDLPRVIGYVLEAADNYGPTREFSQWLRAKLLPVAQGQPWYRAVESVAD